MKKLVLSTLAVGAMVTALTAPAHAASPDPVGQKCRFNSATDVTAEAQTQTGYAEIGPLVITSDSAPVKAECQIYVNGVPDPRAHLAATVVPNAAGANLATGVGPINFHSNVTDVITMCTSAYYDSAWHYWHAYALGDPRLGYWDTTFDVNNCAQATVIDPNPEACPPLLTIDKALNDGNLLSDTWQDCEPYSPII